MLFSTKLSQIRQEWYFSREQLPKVAAFTCEFRNPAEKFSEVNLIHFQSYISSPSTEDALFDLSNTQICLLLVRIDAGQKKLFGDFSFSSSEEVWSKIAGERSSSLNFWQEIKLRAATTCRQQIVRTLVVNISHLEECDIIQQS